MTAPTTDHLRNTELAQLAEALTSQRTRAIDHVISARALTFRDGNLIVPTGEVEITDDGVTNVDGIYVPTVVGDEGIAAKVGIDLRYLRKMRENIPGLIDVNARAWLDRMPEDTRFLARLLRHDGILPADGMPTGVLRALLSDSYRCIDNFDVVTSALEGVTQAGIDPNSLTINADLTDRRMYVRVTSNTIATSVLNLVDRYTDPGTGRRGRDYPLLFAGLVISNSEVGDGAFSVTPRVVFQVCTNGQTLTKEGMRAVHLGSKLKNEGVIEWSDRTQRANLALIRAKTADAVAAFLSTDFLGTIAQSMEAAAGVKLTDPVKTITTVSQKLGYTKDQAASILSAFVGGGTATAGGVMQAVTYVAQHEPDGDRAAALEASAFQALAAAATAR